MNIKDICTYGVTAQGRAELIKFYKSENLTRKEAILAKCYECNNGYVDGKMDCKVFSCPLYGYMPYNPNKDAVKKPMTDEQRKAASERMTRVRSAQTRK